METTRLAYNLASFAIRNRASWRDALELAALCVIAMCRASSATGSLYLGQVRKKAASLAKPRETSPARLAALYAMFYLTTCGAWGLFVFSLCALIPA